MPLLKRKPFKRNPIPEGLRDDDEVFYCEQTMEVFKSYESVSPDNSEIFEFFQPSSESLVDGEKKICPTPFAPFSDILNFNSYFAFQGLL